MSITSYRSTKDHKREAKIFTTLILVKYVIAETINQCVCRSWNTFYCCVPICVHWCESKFCAGTRLPLEKKKNPIKINVMRQDWCCSMTISRWCCQISRGTLSSLCCLAQLLIAMGNVKSRDKILKWKKSQRTHAAVPQGACRCSPTSGLNPGRGAGNPPGRVRWWLQKSRSSCWKQRCEF